MFHDSSFIKAAGITELQSLLSGPFNRQELLAHDWPIVVGKIANRAEFETDLPQNVPTIKRCGDQLDSAGLDAFNTTNPFDFICAQFRQVATSLCDFVEPPDFPKDLFWNRSTVRKGKVHFIGWHTDGDILVNKDGEAITIPNRDVLSVLVSDQDFKPRHLYLQATLELPTAFVGQVTTVFDKSVRQYTTHNCASHCVPVKNKLDAWISGNARIRQATPGDIIAFTSGILHTGVAAQEDCLRTLVVARLTVKSSALGFGTSD